MLWMFQRVKYGPVINEKNAELPDLKPREWALVVPVVALVVLMGVVPNLFLRPTEASVQRIVNRVRQAAPVEIRAGRAIQDDRAGLVEIRARRAIQADAAAPVEIRADGHGALVP
jgi:hypothetical protein